MITEQELNKAMRTLNIVFFALFSSLFFYLIVAYLLSKGTQPAADPGILRPIFYAVSFVIVFITKPIRKKILGKRTSIAPQPGTLQHPVVQKYMTAMINACALSEAIGIFGLVLFILGKSTMDLYILIIVSAFAILQYRPKRGELAALCSDGHMMDNRLA
jgi:hypothetical protein